MNPALIWHTDGQTYASAKDNARALYADTLAPIMDMVEERLNAFLVPMLGMDPATHYCEFDLSSKLAASFEEQAGVLQSSAGGLWMTRNEVRARMNLPALPGADELIVPLNVSEGGLAAPNDTDPTVERFNAAPVPLEKADRGDAVPFDKAASELRVLAKASSKAERELAEAFRKFYERQRNVYVGELSKLNMDGLDIEAAIDAVLRSKLPSWRNGFVRELIACSSTPMGGAAARALSMLGADPDALDESKIDEQLQKLCTKRAMAVMQSTCKQLKKDMGTSDEWTPKLISQRVHKSFRDRMDGRVKDHSASMATAIANAGTCEGARQSGVDVEKEWVCLGHNSRDSHARLDGYRVPIDGLFPLEAGARWPGDHALSAKNTCNCHCRIDIVRSGKSQYRTRRTREVADKLGLADYDEGKLDTAIYRCQQTIGCGGRLWEELTKVEMAGVLDELLTRDPDWVAFGTVPKIDYTKAPRDKYGTFKNDPDRSSAPTPDDYAEDSFSWKDSGGEWRDLFAHDVLSWNGYSFGTRPSKFYDSDGKAIQGASSPDLQFDPAVWGEGYLWEIKSPMAGSKAPKQGNELDYIGQALKDSSRNFRNPYDPDTNQPVSDWDGMRRVILNLCYRPSPGSEEETIQRIRYEIGKRNIAEVIYIDDAGEIHHIKK